VNSQQKKNRIVSSAQKTAERRCFQQKQQGEVQAGRKWRSRGANPPAGDHCAAEQQGRRRQEEQRNAIDAKQIGNVQPDHPVCRIDQLEVALLAVEGGDDQQRQQESQQRRAQRDPLRPRRTPQ
jgi:hypothetical protein